MLQLLAFLNHGALMADDLGSLQQLWAALCVKQGPGPSAWSVLLSLGPSVGRRCGAATFAGVEH